MRMRRWGSQKHRCWGSGRPYFLGPVLLNCALNPPQHRITNTHSVPQGLLTRQGELLLPVAVSRCAFICSPPAPPCYSQQNWLRISLAQAAAALTLIISSPFNSPTCHINYRLYWRGRGRWSCSQLSDIMACLQTFNGPFLLLILHFSSFGALVDWLPGVQCFCRLLTSRQGHWVSSPVVSKALVYTLGFITHKMH